MAHRIDAAEGIRWARVLAIVLVIAAVGELGSRLAIQAWLGEPFRSFDPYVFSGYGVYRPNPAYNHPQFVHNSRGFRNEREFEIDKPANVFRVMAIGASVLYSGSARTHRGTSARVRTDETITAFLEPLLRDQPALQGFEVEVINAGINLQNIRNTVSYYIAELGRYDPDLVLVFGTHNDTAYLEYEDGLDQLFYDESNPTDLEARLERMANEASLAALVDKSVRTAVNRSALAAIAYRVLDRVLQQANWSDSSTEGDSREPPRIAQKKEVENSIRAYLAALDALLTYIEVRGARPVVFWEYLLLQLVDIKPLSPYERDLANFLDRLDLSYSPEELETKVFVRDSVARYLRERSVPLIDIEGEVRGFSGTLFNDYLHYGPEGNRWVAEVVARELEPLIARIATDRQGATSP